MTILQSNSEIHIYTIFNDNDDTEVPSEITIFPIMTILQSNSENTLYFYDNDDTEVPSEIIIFPIMTILQSNSEIHIYTIF